MAKGSAPAKARSLNIFDVISNIQLKKPEYYDTLSDEDKKHVVPFLLMRWMSSQSPYNCLFVNELVNPFVFSLYKHPKLLFQLLTCASVSGKGRVKWQAGPSKSSHSHATKVLQQLYGYSVKQAREVLPLLTSDQLLSYAAHLGWQKEEVSKLTKELNDD